MARIRLLIALAAAACQFDASAGPSSPSDGPAARDAQGSAEASPSDAPRDGSSTAGWSRRRQLSFENSGQNENLSGFPVLVVIRPDRIDYARTQPLGQDLRFVDADGATFLPYEIERWDPTRTSYVWVRVPQIDASSTTDFIWMYYGNPMASDQQAPTEVWQTYRAVWHLGGTLTDSAGHQPAAADYGSTVTDGIIAGARSLKAAQGQYIDTNDAEQLNHWTVEAWAISGHAPGGGSSNGPLMRESNYNLIWDNVISSYRGTTTFQLFGQWRTASFGSLVRDRWHYLASAFDGQTLTAYVNGVLTDSISTPNGNSDLELTTAKIGRHPFLSYYFDGSVDEVRISSSPRSAAWLAAQYASMIDLFIQFGNEEALP